jgi:serralysin
MRRVFLLLWAMGAILVVVGGIAWAASLLGTQAGNTLNGTDESDTIVGAQGEDIINLRKHNDFGYGDSQSDLINGGAGNDRIWLDSGSADEGNGDNGDDYIVSVDGSGGDTVTGGEGTADFCVVDVGDTVDCETEEEVPLP